MSFLTIFEVAQSKVNVAWPLVNPWNVIVANVPEPEAALAWLKKAMDRGFDDWESIRKDPDMKNLRNSPVFEQIAGSR